MLRKKELLLISCLRQDGRLSLTQASKRTHMPVSTLFEKLRRYNREFIRRTTILLNFEAMGYGTRASIFLRTNKDNRERLEKALLQEHQINTMFRITNGWDFLIEVVFKNLQELQIFIERLEENHPVEKQIHFILRDLKKEDFLIPKKPTPTPVPVPESNPDSLK